MGDEFTRRAFLKTTALVVGGAAAAERAAHAQQDPAAPKKEQDMRLQTVGIMSPGDMGSAVGQVLALRGLKVIAALGERSPRTRALAAQAGIADVGTLESLVRQADMVLSILDPDAAVGAAQKVAEAMKSAGAAPLYADCNSISPQSAAKIRSIMQGVGASFVEASIIGAPPRGSNNARIYTSGPQAEAFAQLAQFGLNVRVLGPEEGKAKAIKVCYATITKGTQALCTESMVTAQRLGVFGGLMAELEGSQPSLLKFAQNGLQTMPPKAHRWIGEMNELAATYQGVGLTPRMLAGAADLYTDVGKTALGNESPESQRTVSRSFEEFIAQLERELPRA